MQQEGEKSKLAWTFIHPIPPNESFDVNVCNDVIKNNCCETWVRIKQTFCPQSAGKFLLMWQFTTMESTVTLFQDNSILHPPDLLDEDQFTVVMWLSKKSVSDVASRLSLFNMAFMFSWDLQSSNGMNDSAIYMNLVYVLKCCLLD